MQTLLGLLVKVGQRSTDMIRIEGYAIVSADGMIANADGQMPASLIFPADQLFFTRALDEAALIVHGRHSQERPTSSSQTSTDPDSTNSGDCSETVRCHGAIVESDWRALRFSFGGRRRFDRLGCDHRRH